MRNIQRIHTAAYRPIADLVTYSPLPSASLPHLDPFLFLNHHGHQVYKPHNQGLPFGPHPHRGMETVTFIVAGDIMHKDSQGYQSVIKAGGVQWMTAGRGLIHAEVSSAEFMAQGGELEILQLWVNLPAQFKMAEPNYIGLQKADIPILLPAPHVRLNLIAGHYEGQNGPITSLTNVMMSTVELLPGATWHTEVPEMRTIFFYVVRGSVNVNGQQVAQRQLVEFGHEGSQLQVSASENALVIFGHALPYHEPIVAQGPFVMNTPEEIRQAYHDYQAGKFGVWHE